MLILQKLTDCLKMMYLWVGQLISLHCLEAESWRILNQQKIRIQKSLRLSQINLSCVYYKNRSLLNFNHFNLCDCRIFTMPSNCFKCNLPMRSRQEILFCVSCSGKQHRVCNSGKFDYVYLINAVHLIFFNLLCIIFQLVILKYY